MQQVYGLTSKWQRLSEIRSHKVSIHVEPAALLDNTGQGVETGHWLVVSGPGQITGTAKCQAHRRKWGMVGCLPCLFQHLPGSTATPDTGGAEVFFPLCAWWLNSTLARVGSVTTTSLGCDWGITQHIASYIKSFGYFVWYPRNCTTATRVTNNVLNITIQAVAIEVFAPTNTYV